MYDPRALKGSRYFYDLNTGKLFAQPALALPPVEAPSGRSFKTKDGEIPAGVRAQVISCGSCTPDGQQIAYLGMLPPGIKQRLEEEMDRYGKLSFASLQLSLTGMVIAAVPDDPTQIKWVSQTSPEGASLLGKHREFCPDGSKPKECWP
jgi:hypothetical protein